MQRKNNSNTFIEVEWWGVQNEFRIELYRRDLLHTAANRLKKAWVCKLHGLLYQWKCPTNDVGNGLCHLTFFVTHFMSLYVHDGTSHIGMEMQAETASQGKWQ